MSSNIAVMSNPGETVLDLLKQIDQGHMVLDMEQECKDVVAACKEHMKQGSVTITVKFDPDNKTGAMRVSHKMTSKMPKKVPMASLFFVCDDNTLSRTNPHQRDMFERQEAHDPRTGVVHSSDDKYNGGMY